MLFYKSTIGYQDAFKMLLLRPPSNRKHCPECSWSNGWSRDDASWVQWLVTCCIWNIDHSCLRVIDVWMPQKSSNCRPSVSSCGCIFSIFIAILCVAAVTFMFPQITDECAQARYTTEQCDNLKAATVGITASVFVGASILNAYFWACVFSFYKELKSGVNNTAFKA